MWKTQDYVRRHWPSFQIPLLGITIGVMLFLGVHAVSPHPGQRCQDLGQIKEEWALGMPSQMLMCAAMLDGDLRYARAIMPDKPEPER